MGTEMIAFIEYDKAQWYASRTGVPTPVHPPFAGESEAYSLSSCGSIHTGSKSYEFFGAIAGIRNSTGTEPLHPPRGLPPSLSPEASRRVAANGGIGDSGDSWLTLAEINAALDHQRIDRSRLSFECGLIIAIMTEMESRLGKDRVRLVFGFDG